MDDLTTFYLASFLAMYALGLSLGIGIHAIKTFMEKI